MERVAPPELALAFDNPGLLVSPEKDELHTVLVALDCTAGVVEEAERIGAELVLTHHPLFFHGVKHILKDDPETSAAYALLRRGIGLYAAHTNLDAAIGGVNDVLLSLLGVQNIRPLPPENLGRIGYFAAEQTPTLGEFAEEIERVLPCSAFVSGAKTRKIRCVACVGGAGGQEIAEAAHAGADVYVTGECKHHETLAAEALGLALIVAGHYATEHVVLPPLIDRLQQESNDVQYHLALSEKAPLWRP